jgi:butyrate kinase
MSKILVINPGSTSTKIAMYQDRNQLWQENIEHDADLLKQYPTIYAQLDFRLEAIIDAIGTHNDRIDELKCVMSRGGLLPPLSSGAYEVNAAMLDVLEHRPMNHHASNLGAAIAYKIASEVGVGAYIYDPVTVDEMIDVVRITGLKRVRRHGQGHNLNMRAAALKYCEDKGVPYREQNLIVAHLGGGITLTLQSRGRIIDMISDDEGPFSPERAGLIPDFKLAKLIDVDNLSYQETMKMLQRKGGLMSLLGVSDVRKVEQMIQDGDENAALVYDAMALGVAESIGRLATVANGKINQIILTGGIAYSEMFTEKIIQRVNFIAPVTVIPGENEMQALANGGCRVLNGKEQAKEYVEPSNRPF